MADHLQVGLDVLTRTVLLEAIEHITVAGVLQHFLEGIVVVLLVDLLHVSQEFTAAAHQKCAAPEQVAGGTHLARIDIAQRECAATHEASNLLAVDLVILLLAAVNGFHVQVRGRARN